MDIHTRILDKIVETAKGSLSPAEALDIAKAYYYASQAVNNPTTIEEMSIDALYESLLEFKCYPALSSYTSEEGAKVTVSLISKNGSLIYISLDDFLSAAIEDRDKFSDDAIKLMADKFEMFSYQMRCIAKNKMH